MYRKLIAVGLAFVLLGVAGTAVTANDGGSPVVADHEVTDDLSPDPANDEPFKDGGSGGDDDDSDTCAISPSNDEPFQDGGSC